MLSGMRGFFGRLVNRDAAGAAGISGQGGPSGTWIPAFGGNLSETGLRINQATAMAVSAVYGCVTIRAEDVARCTPSLYAIGSTGERTLVEDHPVAKLLQDPNPVQTWFEFCEQMQMARLLRGNAYAVMLPDRKGDISALIPINPDQVVMLEAPDGSLFYSISRLGLWQTAVLKNMPPSVPAEYVFHLRGPSLSVLLGMSTIAVARDTVGLALAQEKQASRWLRNGARPSGVLKSKKQLNKDVAERLRAQFEAWRSGLDNTGTTVVLEDELDYQTLQLTSVDLQFLSQRNFQIEEIARFWRVPPRKLGRLESSKSSNATQDDQEYVNEAIMPDAVRWEQKFSKVFNLKEEGLLVDFDEGQLLRADYLTRYNGYRIGILTGFLTPNEARRAENLPTNDPTGDALLRPTNMAPQGSELNNEAPDGAGRPPAGHMPQPTGQNPVAPESGADTSGDDVPAAGA
jgi:HK97 family phage portal protein